MSPKSPQDVEAQAGISPSQTTAAQGALSDSRPPLLADASYWGMLITQFLGAFNDNLYKQLMLLLAIPVAAATASDVQGFATFVFSLPFVLFSGFAGYLSDRYSKTPIIVYCKVAEIVVMLLGLAAFYFFNLLDIYGTWFVLFLMGAQSAFFGPGKYGILPELFRPADLPRANGLMLMTTFLAIIFGTVMAGGLQVALAGNNSTAQALWPGLLVCVVIAVVGTLTSLMVRRTPPAQPNSKLTADNLAISSDMFRLMRKDKTLLAAVLVSSVFWLVSGITVPTVNRLGLELLGVNATFTSALSASIGLGIMVGALFAGVLCRWGWGDRCVTLGLLGIFFCLLPLGFWTNTNAPPVADNVNVAASANADASGVALNTAQTDEVKQTEAATSEVAALPKPVHKHVLGFYGSVVALIGMGVFAAIFAIPIQVFLQDRPPAELKGRMIATMNQANFVGIMLSGPLYQAFEAIAGRAGWAISSVFWMMALLILPVALIYRLDSSTKHP